MARPRQPDKQLIVNGACQQEDDGRGEDEDEDDDATVSPRPVSRARLFQ
jgi:hypothetical protein